MRFRISRAFSRDPTASASLAFQAAASVGRLWGNRPSDDRHVAVSPSRRRRRPFARFQPAPFTNSLAPEPFPNRKLPGIRRCPVLRSRADSLGERRPARDQGASARRPSVVAQAVNPYASCARTAQIVLHKRIWWSKGIHGPKGTRIRGYQSPEEISEGWSSREPEEAARARSVPAASRRLSDRFLAPTLVHCGHRGTAPVGLMEIHAILLADLVAHQRGAEVHTSKSPAPGRACTAAGRARGTPRKHRRPTSQRSRNATALTVPRGCGTRHRSSTRRDPTSARARREPRARPAGTASR